MASSGVIYGSRRVDSYGPRLELHWRIVSQSTTNNTSTIEVTSYFDVQGSVYLGGNAGSATVGGVTKSYSYTPSDWSATRRKLATTTHTVSHNSDGRLSVQISGRYNFDSFNWNGYNITSISASQTVSLDTILRGIRESSISLASGFNSVIGAKAITFTKDLSSVNVRINFKYFSGTDQKWIGEYQLSSDYTSGAPLTFSDSLITEMHKTNPNNQTVYTIFSIYTYLNGTRVQKIDKTSRLFLNVDAPNISVSVKCIGRNQSLLGASNRGVQGVHDVEISVSATAKNYASIKSYKISFQDESFNSKTAKSKLKKAGNLDIKIYVEDTRGYSKTITKSVTSYAYRIPMISNLKGARYISGTLNPIGTDYKITGTVNAYIVSPSGRDVNKAWWRIDYGSNVTNPTILQTGTLRVEEEKIYTVYFGDSFSDTQRIIGKIPIGQATFVLGKNSVGVGVVPPTTGKGLYIKDGLINNEVLPAFEDFTSKCKVNVSGISNFGAYKYGRIVNISFSFKPQKTGFNTNLITIPDGYEPMSLMSAAGGSSSSSADLANGGYSIYLSKYKQIHAVISALPSNEIDFTLSYISVK